MRTLNATAPDQPFFVYYVPGGSHSPHQPTQGMDRKIQGQVRHGLERHARADIRQPETVGCRSRERRSSPSGRISCRSGKRCRPTRKSSSPGRRRCSAPTRPIPTMRSAVSFSSRGHGQARQHADHLHLRRQRHQPRRHVGGHAQPDTPRTTASWKSRSKSNSSSTTTGGWRRPTRIWPFPGRGRSIRRSNGPSRSLRTSAARGKAWRSRGRRASRTSAASARSSTT